MKKKIWKRPELIVIARSNPEERVLTACKHVLISIPLFPANWDGACIGDFGNCGVLCNQALAS